MQNQRTVISLNDNQPIWKKKGKRFQGNFVFRKKVIDSSPETKKYKRKVELK